MSEKTLLMIPEIRRDLETLGRSVLGDDVASLFGEEPYTIAAFSDYAGDAREAKYEVYATYLVHLNSLQPLLDRVAAVKQRHAIAERTIDFKGRKDRAKAAALDEYLDAFANHPGICIAICWDKRIRSFRRAQADRAKLMHELAALGADLSFAVAERVVKAIGFLAVMGHLLREQDRFAWISDEDAIFQGEARRLLPEALRGLGNQVVRKRLAHFGYTTPLMPEHEVMLTLPDLVAGALAAGLPAPIVGGRITTPDLSTDLMLRRIAQLKKGTKLVTIVVEADVVRERIKPRVLDLAPWEPLIFRQLASEI